MDSKRLEELFARYVADPTSGSNVVDLELRKIVAGLGISVLMLDKSSTQLAKVNVVLAAVMIIVGIAQVVMPFLKH